MGQFKGPPAVSNRTCKCALLVSEQLAFKQLLGHCGRIDRNKGTDRARALGVDGFGQMLFADPGLAGEQNGRIARNHLMNVFHENPHGLTFSNEISYFGFGNAPAIIAFALDELAPGFQGGFDGLEYSHL